MGFRDSMALAQKQQAEEKELRKQARSPEGMHYLTEVNKGSINMAVWQQHLNERFAQGYRLAFCFEQAGNTVMVFEKRD